MLSENEIEAVEYLKSEINYNKQRIEEIENKNDISLIGHGTIHDAYKLQNCQYLILLNLINKLEKGNKKLKDNNKSLLKKLRNRIKEVKKLTKYALYKKEFATLNRIIKEKDKQIDLMAKQIDILMNTNNEELDCFIPTDFSSINDCVKKKSCEDCIKKYFEVEAKKGE